MSEGTSFRRASAGDMTVFPVAKLLIVADPSPAGVLQQAAGAAWQSCQNTRSSFRGADNGPRFTRSFVDEPGIQRWSIASGFRVRAKSAPRNDGLKAPGSP